MKIFSPFKKAEYHPYLNEIKKYSQNDFEYKDKKFFNPAYKIVNIHWPEAIFNWQEPTQNDLEDLEKTLKIWRNSATIIYTKHDIDRTKGTTPNFTKLFKIIEENTDVFIHLGEYSKKIYTEKYPGSHHEIIVHPLLENSFRLSHTNEARSILGINKEAIVIIAPGNIRNFKERDMVLQSFKAINSTNKVLICTNMRNELRLDFPGRVRIKKYLDVQKFIIDRFRAKHLPPQYFFTYNALSNEALSLRMSAADIVLVPRIDILNSGIVFLGLTFGKVTVGPAIGNIEEQLKELNYPVFNPNSISSVTEALEKGIRLHKSGEHTGSTLTKYQSINVAKEYDRIFLKYKKS